MAATTDIGPNSALHVPGVFFGSVCPAMKSIERAASELASTELPIFIIGECGTGKRTLATVIHRFSRRSSYEVVRVNCQTLAVSSESDSNQQHPFQLTSRQLRGTLFLEEVLALPPTFQGWVTAHLSDKSVEPPYEQIAPRIIAASRTDQDARLLHLVRNRELYYQLRGVLLHIPPLRSRREDIPHLANFLLHKHAASFGRYSVQLSPRAEEVFFQHSWPGNVSELENAIKMLLAVEDESLVLEGISFSSGGTDDNPSNPPQTTLSLKEVARLASRSAERQLITEVLRRTSWNRKRAARELRISYKALLYKLKQSGITDSEFPPNQLTPRGTLK